MDAVKAITHQILLVGDYGFNCNILNKSNYLNIEVDTGMDDGGQDDTGYGEISLS